MGGGKKDRTIRDLSKIKDEKEGEEGKRKGESGRESPKRII